MTLMFLVFGEAQHNHLQANFAILTHLLERKALSKVVVMTDAPENYRAIRDERVVVDAIRIDDLTDWRGPHDFFWRIKIKALEAIAGRYPEDHVMYTDADTFRFGHLAHIQQKLEKGETLMHAREGKVSELRTSTEKQMWKQCRGKTFGGISINEHSTMFNAGVVAIPRSLVKKAVALALRICDDMCAADVTRRLVEQFALSLALAEVGKLGAANATIGHYWGNKAGWNELINSFFLRHHLAGSTYAEQVADAANTDFRSIPIYRRSSGTQNKLHRLVDKQFEKHIYAYVPKPGEEDDRSERLLARHLKS